MSPSSSRLERALELFCEHQQRGGEVRELIAMHPDLADLLASFVDDAPPVVPDGQLPADFELVREIGRGGVGVVYEAHQRSLGRRVALKMLHAEFATSPASLARMHREAQVLARLDHPGIVRVHAASAVASRPWLAMEYVDGESLAHRLQALGETGHRGASMRLLVAAIARVAEALHHAHVHGIVHRDVKPSNILLRANGDAVLGDFGLAREVAAPGLTHTGTAAGTPYYMAPESILGGSERHDARSDTYSLGLTLFECLALQRAYDGSSTQEVLQRILDGDPPDIRRVAPGVPVDLAAIVHKAIERQPERRYATAQEFVDDLRAFLELRPIRARPVSRLRRLARYSRRHPMAGAVAVVGVCGVLFAVVLALQWPQLHAAELARLNEQIEDEIAQATLARSSPDAAECYRHFRRAIELAPDRDESVAGLCLALLDFEGPAPSLQELERHPGAGTSPNLRRLRAVIVRRLGRQGEADAIERDLGPARNWLELWLTAVPLLEDPGDSEALQRADGLLSRALLVAPRPRLWLHLQFGALQVVRDDREGRRAAAEALLELWPDDRKALMVAGTCLAVIDPSRACTLLQRALDLGAAPALTRVDLGIAQILDHHPEQGVESLAAAMPMPGLSEPQRQRILEVLAHAGAFDRAAQLAEQWLEREPGSVTARRFVARAATRAGDLDRGLELFRECIAAAPGHVELRMDLAFALSLADQNQAAVTLLQQIAAEQPRHRRMHDLLLDVADALGDRDLVIAELGRWVANESDDSESWQALAGACLERNGPGDAERALAAAERADYLTQGKAPELLRLRADALERCGYSGEAERVRARAAAIAPAQAAGR